MAYGYNSNKRGRKPSRSKTKQLEVRRILASLTMAAGILAMPFSVGEAAIVRKEGTGPAIAPNGNVYNIDPEGSNGNFAYNRFKEFNLHHSHVINAVVKHEFRISSIKIKICIRIRTRIGENNILFFH